MIDWTRVTAVRREVGETEFRPLVELFLDEIEAAIMGMDPGDPVSLRNGLQFLKGCALNIGLRALCRTCDAWGATLAGDAGAVLPLDAIKGCYGASKQALMRDIDARTTPGAA